MSQKKAVFRTTRGAAIEGFRRVEKATADADVTDKTDSDPPKE